MSRKWPHISAHRLADQQPFCCADAIAQRVADRIADQQPFSVPDCLTKRVSIGFSFCVANRISNNCRTFSLAIGVSLGITFGITLCIALRAFRSNTDWYASRSRGD